MADLLRRGHYADEIMGLLAAEEKQKAESSDMPAQPDGSTPSGTAKKPRPRHNRKRTD
jgi:hypothetical protein